MEEVKYDQAFLFAYSMRDRTHANRNLEDDVPESVKLRRLQEVIDVYRRNLLEKTKAELHSQHLVLIEGPSTKSTRAFPTLTGRTDGNRRVVFPSSSPIWTDFQSTEAILGSRMIREYVDQLRGPAALVTPVEGEGTIRIAYNYFMKEVSTLLEKLQATKGGSLELHDAGRYLVPGAYVVVQIVEAKGPTLKGVPVALSSIGQFHQGSISKR